jgi:glycosyltransferase involved in cell wall biosynthesis
MVIATPRILFVLKYREASWGAYGQGGLSSGLLNSATFVKDMLVAEGIDAKLVQVVDNNCIDREVALFKPTHVIIEALWVVPEKIELLAKLHPTVKWVIRNHSETPFLANEGIAVEWLLKYVQIPNVVISNNAPRAQRDFLFLARQVLGALARDKVVYLPNFYPILDSYLQHTKLDHQHGAHHVLNVGCFGAIRPLKNHLLQAVAALKYAERHGQRLRFHINATRVEGRGEPILKNLTALFEHLPEHELVEHGWLAHKEFLELVSTMDIGLQCSFSETFNIVGADFVARNVPLIGSREIPWINPIALADPNNSDAIADAMARVIDLPINPNIENLSRYVERSRRIWLAYFTENRHTPLN